MAEERRKVSWLSWLITYVVLYGVYLLFVSTLTKVELIAGIATALIATIASGVFGTVGVVHFKPTLRELLEAWRLPYYAFQGTWELFNAFAKQLFTKQGADSLVRAVPYEVGGDDAQSAGRRALAVTYTTLTPNFVVFGIAHKQQLLIYHQVLAGEVLQMTINLGAEP
jgi:multisubunit Na+/H+ antiporter MnhE subunit